VVTLAHALHLVQVHDGDVLDEIGDGPFRRGRHLGGQVGAGRHIT
jgi:hypothetical protein